MIEKLINPRRTIGPKIKFWLAIAFAIAGAVMAAILRHIFMQQPATYNAAAAEINYVPWLFMAFEYCAPAAALLLLSALFGFFHWWGQRVLHWIAMLFVFGMPTLLLAGVVSSWVSMSDNDPREGPCGDIAGGRDLTPAEIRKVGGTADAPLLNYPTGIAMGRNGILYVADNRNQVIRQIAPDGKMSILAGNVGIRGCADGTGAQATFMGVDSITVGGDGTVYAVDRDNNHIRMITPEGVVTTLRAAPDPNPYGPNWSRKTASGIAVDDERNVYLALFSLVVRVSPAGKESVIAGNESGSAERSRDGAGKNARFNSAQAIARDPAGNLFVADDDKIKNIDLSSAVTTVAGPSGSGDEYGAPYRDGPVREARFSSPEGIALKKDGSLVIADRVNGAIRVISPSGIVSTLAGSPGDIVSRDGSSLTARFSEPHAVAIDARDNVYVSDSRDNTIKKVTPDGTVTTFAGVSNQTERDAEWKKLESERATEKPDAR